MCLCVTTVPEDSSHFQQEYEHQNQHECYRDEYGYEFCGNICSTKKNIVTLYTNFICNYDTFNTKSSNGSR